MSERYGRLTFRCKLRKSSLWLEFKANWKASQPAAQIKLLERSSRSSEGVNFLRERRLSAILMAASFSILFRERLSSFSPLLPEAMTLARSSKLSSLRSFLDKSSLCMALFLISPFAMTEKIRWLRLHPDMLSSCNLLFLEMKSYR